MRTTLFLVSAIPTVPMFSGILSTVSGIDVISDPLLNAGGMGILGWLLYKHIEQHHKSIAEVTTNHKAGLESVSKEIHGLRDDIKSELQEGHRILVHAIGLGAPDDKQEPRKNSG